MSEISRQRQRLEADLVSRHAGVILTCILFGFFLPFWFVFLIYLLIVGSEIGQFRMMRAFEEEPSRGRHVAILANSTAGLAVYSLPALFIWQMPDVLIKFTGVLSLIGALLNVSNVRSTHLVMGALAGLPPAAALLWLPLQDLFDPAVRYPAAIAAAGVIAVLGYFISALVQNHRSQAELIEAVERIDAVSHEKSRFLSAMSHEVRTPLNAILGHSQLMKDEADPKNVPEHARAVETAARALQMIVDDVTDLASAAEGELYFRPVTAIIRSELDAVAAFKLPVTGAGDARISVEIASEVPEFGRFDPILLRKCLTHFCTILIGEYSGSDPAQLDLRCALAPGRKDRLRFTIVSRGSGQPTGSGGAVPGGDSLATTFVQRIAEVMGARASVLRSPDGSPVARIELPFVMVPDPPATGAESVYGRLRVLVVDDIPTNRLVVVQMLRGLRIEAVESESGSDALERLAAEEFDLVLLDMNMPDMDGEATFREIRTSGRDWAEIPVVALTADAVAVQRDHYMSLGMNGFISKPVDQRLLWSEILTAVPPPPPL